MSKYKYSLSVYLILPFYHKYCTSQCEIVDAINHVMCVWWMYMTRFLLRFFSCATKKPLSFPRDTTTQSRMLWTSLTIAGSLMTLARSAVEMIWLIVNYKCLYKCTCFELLHLHLLFFSSLIRLNTERSILALWGPGSPSPIVPNSSSARLSAVTLVTWVLVTLFTVW